MQPSDSMNCCKDPNLGPTYTLRPFDDFWEDSGVAVDSFWVGDFGSLLWGVMRVVMMSRYCEEVTLIPENSLNLRERWMTSTKLVYGTFEKCLVSNR